MTGTSATDSATVTGTSGTPTGTVTFTLYNVTTGKLVAGYSDTETLSNGSATSTSTGQLSPGSYDFLVTYSGDGTYAAVSPATAEPFSIGLQTPTLNTTPNVTGTSATDSATVTGTSGTPTGTVTFTLYNVTTGKLVAGYSDTETLSNGSATSTSTGQLSPGSYDFLVTYSGDGTYAAVSPATAEPFSIGLQTPTLNTTPYVSGKSAYDTATVSGTSGTPTGTVTFTLYKGVYGSGLPMGYSYTTSLNAVGSATSTTVIGLSAGSYYFLVTYSGDGTYGATTGIAEFFSIGLQTPSVNTTPYVSGKSASDTATVSGLYGTPTGTVTFKLYQGTSPSGTLVGTYGTATLVGGSATSTTAIGLGTGSYYFLVSYSGDGTYGATTGVAEPFSIGLQSASVNTTPNATGTSASDTATVSGTSGTPTGTVTFMLYQGTSPNGTLVGTYGTATLVGGSATSTTATGLSAGSYYFLVSYSGDGTYGATTGVAEPFSISLQSASVSTTPNTSGTSASDTATVSGAYGTPTGTVTFTLYNATTGARVGGYTDTQTLSNGAATSTTVSGLAAGSYYFMVTYSGDGTYAAVSPGSPEPFQIQVAKPSKVPKKPAKKVTPYKIPTKPPKTGFGGAAHSTPNGGLLAGGLSTLLAGLAMMVVALRRRRRA